jgi:ParB-like chromosome segregation protein Spo0J
MAVDFKVAHTRTAEYRCFPENITINPDLNGRHETPDIEWLIADILRHGQHTPVVIRNDGGMPTLVAGFSRWRAISEINKRGMAPVKLQVRCTYVQCNEAESFLINISENQMRNPTTLVDDAHNIQRLLNVYAMTEEQVAKVYWPTAHTEREIAEAVTFVRERIKLISLTPEAEAAVRSGRVKSNAASTIAKLSAEQQKDILNNSPEGAVITRKDISLRQAPVRAPKGVQKDAELMRRVWAVLEDVADVLGEDNKNEYIEIDRVAVQNLLEYVNELRAPKPIAA